jgi:hypothetical protein
MAGDSSVTTCSGVAFGEAGRAAPVGFNRGGFALDHSGIGTVATG